MFSLSSDFAEFDIDLEETGDSLAVANRREKISRDRREALDARDRVLENLRDDASSAAEDKKYGGIDLNPANLKIEINKENGGVNVQYDPVLIQQLREQGIDGFVPFIIDMQPMSSVMPLLSQAADAEQLQGASI